MAFTISSRLRKTALLFKPVFFFLLFFFVFGVFAYNHNPISIGNNTIKADAASKFKTITYGASNTPCPTNGTPCVLGANTALAAPYQDILSDVQITGHVGIGVNPDAFYALKTNGQMLLDAGTHQSTIIAPGAIDVYSNVNNPLESAAFTSRSITFNNNGISGLNLFQFVDNSSGGNGYFSMDLENGPASSLSVFNATIDDVGASQWYMGNGIKIGGNLSNVYFGSGPCPTDNWFRIQNTLNVGYSGCNAGGKQYYYTDLAVGKLFSANAIKYSDVAEVMDVNPSTSPESGDIMTADSSVNANTNVLQQSAKRYDQSVVGVISSPQTAGFILGIKGATPENVWNQQDKKPIALAGKVLVKVSTINGAIKKGDFVTSSELTGIGMKATQSGMVIGTALEDFNPESKPFACPSQAPYGTQCGQVLISFHLLMNQSVTTDQLESEIQQLQKEVSALQNSK